MTEAIRASTAGGKNTPIAALTDNAAIGLQNGPLQSGSGNFKSTSIQVDEL